MKYYKIRTNWDSKITGKRNSDAAVEQNKNSFFNKKTEKEFNNFFLENIKNINRTRWGSYVIYEPPQDFDLTYFPKTKSVKELDFMTYRVRLIGIEFLISERVYNIFSKYKLPLHNKIPVKINTFSQNYFLIGFPTLLADTFDFSKSIFFDYRIGKKVIFENVYDFENTDYNRHMATPIHLFLNTKMDYDIIDTRVGTFLSSTIIEEFKKEMITGYEIKEGILEN